MRLTGQQFENLQTALLSAYRSKSGLARMVRFSLDENLNVISSGGNLSEITFDLIEWAESNGQVNDLIVGAYRSNPGNPDIVSFKELIWDSAKSTSVQSEEKPRPQEPPQRRLTAFLCHSSADKSAVRKLFAQLRSDGIEPWLDEENLLPGQNWHVEIPKAVRSSDVVLICLSKKALGKDGYLQDEIHFALEEAERQEGIYLIPVRLDNVKIPDRLSHLHWVDLFDTRGHAKLVDSLKKRAINRKTIIPEIKKDFVLTARYMPLATRLQWTNAGTILLAVLTIINIIAAIGADGLAILDRLRAGVTSIPAITVPHSTNNSPTLVAASRQKMYPRDFRTKFTAERTLFVTKQITVAYSVESAPFSFKSPDNLADGIEIDLFIDIMESAIGISEEVPYIENENFTVLLDKRQLNENCPEPSEFHDITGERFANCKFLKINWLGINPTESDEAVNWPDTSPGQPEIDIVIGAVSKTPRRCFSGPSDAVDPNLLTKCTLVSHWTDRPALLVRDISITSFCSGALGGREFIVMANGVNSTSFHDINDVNNSPFGSDLYRNCETQILYGDKVFTNTRENIIHSVLDNDFAYIGDSIILEYYRRIYDSKDESRIVEHSDELNNDYVFFMKSENSGLAQLMDLYIVDVIDPWREAALLEIGPLMTIP